MSENNVFRVRARGARGPSGDVTPDLEALQDDVATKHGEVVADAAIAAAAASDALGAVGPDIPAKVVSTQGYIPEPSAVGQVSYWDVGTPMVLDGRRIARWDAAGDGNRLDASAGSKPAMMGGFARFATTWIGHKWALTQGDFQKVASYPLPDASNGAATGGFTGTGMCDLPDGRTVIMNDGRATEAVPGTQAPSLIITPGAPYSKKVTETLLAPLYPGIGSVQGVAYDSSDGTLWFADYGLKKIRHISLAGAVLSGDITRTWTPNGLAYDAASDALWVVELNGSAAQIAKVSCSTGLDLITPIAFAGFGLTMDHLHFDPLSGLLYITYGANGDNGGILVFDPRSGQSITRIVSGSGTAGIKNLQAVEGIIARRPTYRGGQLHFDMVNDGGFHGTAAPALNLIQRYAVDYKMPKGLATGKVLLGMVVRRTGFMSGTGQPKIMISSSSPFEASFDKGWCFNFLSDTDTLQFYARNNTGSAGYYKLWTGVTLQNTWNILEVEYEAGVGLNLYVNGSTTAATASTTSGSIVDTGDFADVLGVSLGCSRSYNFAPNRLADFDLKGAFIGNAFTDRANSKLSGFLAHRHGLASLLPGGHTYKTNPPTW